MIISVDSLFDSAILDTYQANNTYLIKANIMNHYNITFEIQGYKHSLSLVANEENHAKIVFKNIMMRRNIDSALCSIVVLELSSNKY